jgi:bifunctional non-homologous end joining protein LigD
VKEENGLRYLGRVGTGYGEAVTKMLVPALKGVATDRSPFFGPRAPKAARDIHWVKPVLVVEVEHGGYTEAGSLRQAAFKGLREDKTAAEVTQAPQTPTQMGDAKNPMMTTRSAGKPGKVMVAGVTISSPDKVLWPAVDDRPAITKADLARYYEAAAERILAHVADRPTSIIRAPEGIAGETFFQRHAMPGSNPRLKLIDVEARTPYVAAADVGGLVAIAQSGGLELHPWGCAPGEPEIPDQITFDLDPDEGLNFADVIAASKVVKAKVEALGLAAFVKTTGGKGLHVVVPIKTDARSRVTWDQNKAFAKAVAEQIRAEAPDRFTTTLAKKARGGKIFIDYLRNGRMATAVAPWSPRARPGAGIAFPLSWAQVKAELDPAAFNLWTYGALLKKPDPWANFRASAVSLKSALKAMGV